MFKAFLTLFIALLCSFVLVAQNAQEIATEGYFDYSQVDPNWVYPTDGPDAMLYDNGPAFNTPGGHVSGADLSLLETALGMNTLGAGHQFTLGYRMADDFTVPAGETWTIDSLVFYAYQTNSTTTSTITGVYFQIWDGDPSAGGTIVWGDLTTNRLSNTYWSNIYRGSDNVSTARPIMRNVCGTSGLVLTEGTYWIDWSTDGSLTSGPWAPPIAILGQTTTGNALQYTTAWAPFLDSGTSTPQGLPFEIWGTGGGGGPFLFYDNFDTYTAGGQLACQNPTDWTTWSNLPCDPVEDAYISSTYSLSPPNSVVFVQNNDVVYPNPTPYDSTGIWELRFSFYIPSGKAGYFNVLSGFTPDPYEWAFQVYFDVGGGARLDAGAASAATWTYTYDTWHTISAVMDLDGDQATLYQDGTQIYQWQFTLGSFGAGCAKRIAGVDIFGGTVNDEMYMDNFWFGDWPVPVELTSFAADVNSNGQVVLNWETATELNNLMFEIERSNEGSEFYTIGYVNGAGTTTEPQQYSYLDATVNTGTYFYRLKNVDFDGRYYYSDVVEVEVVGPLTFALEQNYPNPFNPSTNIKFSVPDAGDIKLAVYNIVGEQVAVLVDGFTDAGFYNVTFDASSLPSGVYLYKLQSANSVETKKMMLLK